MKKFNTTPPQVFTLHLSTCFFAAALLAGCSTAPRQEPPPPPVAQLPPPAVAKALPSAPPGQFPRSGGYYLDDGPGDKPPANLDTIPDAVPRVEPLHRGAMRPYTVMGRQFVPMTAHQTYRARGVATWYGRRYHGKLTSNGETYDMYAMSAAHPTLPLPSYVRVTHVGNGRSVVVRVNDRGPFIDNRLIDLSYTAAHRLGMLAGGSTLVDVELILPGASTSAQTPAPTPVMSPEAKSTVPEERAIPTAAENGGVFLQLGAFGARENAEAYAARLRADVAWLAAQVQVVAHDGLFRVRAGPYANSNDARASAERISATIGIKPMVQIK